MTAQRSSRFAAMLAACPLAMFAAESARAQVFHDDGRLSNVNLDAERFDPLFPSLGATLPPPELPGHEYGARDRSTDRETPSRPGEVDWLRRERLLGDLYGLRAALEEAGIEINASLVAEWTRGVHNALRTRTTFRHLADLNVTLDFDQLLNLEGGTFFLALQTAHGRAFSDDLGEAQTYSNIEAGRGVDQLAEIWYEQWLFDRTLRAKIGKVDANAEFAFIESAGDFLNASFGLTPTAFAFATFPEPAFSVNLFWYPSDSMYLGAGVYDGAAQEGVRTGTRGPSTFFGSPADLLFIGEVGFTWGGDESLAPGRLAVGGWHHNGTFDRLDGGRERGAEGLYALIEHAIFRQDPTDSENTVGVQAFLGGGVTRGQVAGVTHHLAGGLTWTGPFPDREDDRLGLGVSWLRFDRELGTDTRHECVIEALYALQVTPSITVQPGVQWFIRPGGDERREAAAASLRVMLTF